MATELTGLHAKFTGDSSDFKAAAASAVLLVDQFGYAIKSVRAEQDAAAAASKKLTADFNKLKLETDAVYAATVRYQKAAELVTKVAAAEQWATEQLKMELARLANHYGVAEVAGLQLNEQVRSARFHAANLTAQFYDIGMMLAAGQSPLMLAVQQGSQISQVMLAAGGSVKQTGRLLLSAFTSLISPTSLLTIGLIAGAAALVQWGMSALGAAQNTEELKKREDEYRNTVDALTAATKRLRDERALAAGVADTQEELSAAATRLDLETRLAEKQREMNALLNAGTQAMSFGAAVGLAMRQDQVKEQQKIIQGQIDELQFAMQQLDYQQQLTTAEKRRADEYRDRMREQFLAEQEAAAQSQRQADLINLRKNGFHLMAGETSAVSFYLGQGADEAERLGKVDLESSVAAAANSAATLAANLGVSLENAQRMLQLGYQAPGEVVLDPRDPRYDKGAAMRATQFGFTYGNGQSPATPPAAAGTGGGGASTDALESELEQLRNSLLTQEQLEIESYARRQETLQNALQQKLITQEEYARMMEQAEATHQFAMLQATNDGVRSTLSSLGQLFQGSKEISAAIALANSYLAFTEVLKDPAYIGRPFARFAAAAAALSSGLAAVQSIKSAQPGSAGGGSISTGGASVGDAGGSAGTSAQISLQLVGGDMYSRDQVINLINAINDAVADGAVITVR